ncbi:hypothetical protein AK830_g2417 [Neonectria ditissima]|uniref:Zona occludens toxin N-terminal domain-containing protein n=1 Tax=Neonectria ditissima TaxID=78410 RepID=A0A0P7BBA1_9HYPO|nr:hypothetical protein AK830_g2417 [Neonectria ditissima]
MGDKDEPFFYFPADTDSESDDARAQFDLLRCDDESEEASTINTTPLFTESVRKHVLGSGKESGSNQLSQYGLLAANVLLDGPATQNIDNPVSETDPRIFFNVAAPTSMFICGSQGSGKSHTTSVLLENCLIPCQANQLPHPLTGLVFHYDTFSSDTGGLPCEAACLSSHDLVDVRVLCPPTNIGHIKRIYKHLPNVVVEELRINQSDLNTKRMLDLMAVSSIQGSGMPLYLHVVSRILREQRILQQRNGTAFDYAAFKLALENESLTEGQLAPLKQRLDTLESFMVEAQTMILKHPNKKKSPSIGNSWKPRAGQLTIVDLSCPCVTAEMACSLFNVCLSLFLEQDATVGRVVALDEAHKYMGESIESRTLTEALLSTIRLQRHLGARVIISTQEPTVSPKLIDLCSVTIVHRFTSPAWLKALERHLAGISALPSQHGTIEDGDSIVDKDRQSVVSPYDRIQSPELLFSRIVALRTGEAFVFAPSATIGISTARVSSADDDRKDSGKVAKPRGGDSGTQFIQLGNGVMKVRIRKRVTTDGGRSIMAH